ncbi:MAG: hypothetical protein ACI4DY_10765 [Monoglobaceae bacterium]
MKVKKIISVLTSVAVIFGAFSIFVASAEEETSTETIVYKASDAWSETSNTDSIWRWLYRNDSTASAESQYVEYTTAKAGDSTDFAAPSQNEDGTYNYAASGSTSVVVYCDSTANPGRRNAVGQYWARLSTATGSAPLQSTNNRIVKQFTAPKSGRVVISAEDMSGAAKIYNAGLSSTEGENKYKGAVIRIVKKSAEGDEELFKYDFNYAGKLSEIPSNGVSVYNFNDLACGLEAGDKLWFEISGETGGSAYAKKVFWNPVVNYCQDPLSVDPDVTMEAPVNQVFTVTLPSGITVESKDCISISGNGSPSVSEFSQDSETKSISLSFDGLVVGSEYSVVITGKDADSKKQYFTFSFATESIYKSSDAWSETSNTDSIWRWLYRNDSTASAESQYVEYTTAKAGDSTDFAAPSQNEDGTYNYAASGSTSVVVYCDSTANPGRRNAVGQYWARLSTATGSAPLQSTNNRIVKQFTAPKSGRVVISAEDMSGAAKIYNAGLSSTEGENKYKGAVIRIVKKSAEGDEELFKYDFNYAGKLSEVPSNGVSVYNFREIACDLETGDKLWFEISGETGGSAYAKKVFWNPKVKYFNGGDTVYCSASGTETGFGQENDPCTLSRAIELVKDGGVVIVDGTITLDDSFEWPTSDKTVMIQGKDDTSEVDISAVTGWFNINSNAVFDNIKIGCAVNDDGTGKNQVAANGYHVIIKDTVTTTNVIGGLIGGSSKKSVASTNLEVYGGKYNTILGGSNSDGGSAVSVNGNCVLTVGGYVNSDLDDNDWDNVRRAVIHGGGYGGSVTGDCVLNLTGSAKAKYVYGGQNGLYGSQNLGKVTVNVNGGSYMNVYAILKNTKNENSTAVNIDTTAELNMNGGKAEGLFGAQNSIMGNITINALGGTVTRRIIAGSYNDWSTDWQSSNYITGTTTVVIGSGLEGFTDTQIGSGIFGGSRIGDNPTDETGTLIFTGGSYAKFKSAIGRSDVCGSNHDYLAAVSGNGTVVPKSAGVVILTADDGYYTMANGTETADGDYTLTSGTTNVIEFISEAAPRIKGISVSGNATQVTYSGAVENSVVVAALYDSTGKMLLDIKYSSAATDAGDQSSTLDFTYSMESGKQYVVSAMLWNGIENVSPLCKKRTEQVTISQ